jgi:hypothetical protein
MVKTKQVKAFAVIEAGYEQLQEEADKWEPYEVNLNRGTCGLGMSLEDRFDQAAPTSRVRVSAITPGKPVAICGLVAVGDVLWWGSTAVMYAVFLSVACWSL